MVILALGAALRITSRTPPCEPTSRESTPAGELLQSPTFHSAGVSRELHRAGAFVANRGQWGDRCQFLAWFGDMQVAVERSGWMLVLKPPTGRTVRTLDTARRDGAPGREQGAAVRMTFAGARDACIVPGPRLTGDHSYFVGNDARRWRAQVPRHASLRLARIYDGVDLDLRSEAGTFEYDMLLRAGADLGAVEVHVEGADPLRLDEHGALCIDTTLGTIRQRAPTTWETRHGRRHPIECRFRLLSADRFGFKAPGWDGEHDLVIDPGLAYSTYFGAGDQEDAASMAVDAGGVVTFAGITSSPTFPVTPGAFDVNHNGGFDAFVARLDPSRPPSQQLLFATFLGGSNNEEFVRCVVDASGVVSVCGSTGSTDFPTTSGAFDTTHNGLTDGFVVRLDPSRTGQGQLLFSTYLGGTNQDYCGALANDAAGTLTIAGGTVSAFFPTTGNAFARAPAGGGDAFVVRIDPSQPPSGQLVYATLFGGADSDGASALTVDRAGTVTFVGITRSANFPTTNTGFDRTHNGQDDGFVVRLDPAQPPSQQLVYGTFLGGGEYDGFSALAASDSGVITLCGASRSANFPITANAFDPTHNVPGYPDGIVVRLDPSRPPTSQLEYGSFLGGTRGAACADLAVDAAGIITLAGITESPDFPTTRGALFSLDPPHTDGFITRLDPSRPPSGQLLYSTYFGGNVLEGCWAIAVDALGVATVVGGTTSTDLPTTSNAFNSSYSGRKDVFLARLDLLPTGATLFGDSSPGCFGAHAIGVTAMPSLGEQRFAITCNNARSGWPGLFVVSNSRLASPASVLGTRVWLDPTATLWITAPVAADARGAAELPLPIPPSPRLAGLRLFAQCFWSGPASPPPCPPQGLSASNAIEVTIQL